jgi:hypothetical protein
MVKTFIQWCESNKRDLTFLTERGLRTGIHYPMPTGYVKHQYPDSYFKPVIATATQDLANFNQYKDKAPSDDAP